MTTTAPGTAPAAPPPTAPACHTTAPSPLGPLTLVVDGAGALAGVFYADHSPAPDRASWGARVDPDHPRVAAVVAATADYLAGRSAELAVVVAEQPGTPFQQAVWRETARIPAGGVLTYAQVADRVGRPGASRAVGSALARNAVCLAVPCHRVLASGGRVTGYAGGAARKRWLLALEAGGPPPALPGPTDAPDPRALPGPPLGGRA